MRQAVILVGGRGTRLGEIARDTPKPLLPIAGERRFLDYLLENVARHGVEEILLLAGHLSHIVKQHYDGARVGASQVRVIAETEPKGTGGALKNAEAALDERFFMLNGDSYFDVNYLALAAALQRGVTGALALRRVEDAGRYGSVDLSGGSIVAFREKDLSAPGAGLISGGVYALRRNVLDLIAETPCSLETDVFPKLAAAGALAGVECDGFFIDIGLPNTLAEARTVVPQHARRGAVFFDRDGTLNRDDGYTHKPESLAWQPGAIEAIRRCNDAGRFVVVVTNQAGVARGLYDEDAVQRFHAHMQTELHPHGAHVDAFYQCPYHGDGVVPELAHANHPDRKPNPGMLRRALAELPINRGRSFMVGDSSADVDAAIAADLPGYRIAPGQLLEVVERGLAQAPEATKNHAVELKQRAELARAWLFEHALPLWWRRGYDSATESFFERLAPDGSPALLPRRVRVQARQTIVFARAGRLGWDGPWREATEAGAKVLLERCIRPDGGTRHLLSPADEPRDERRDLYDHAFVMFALAEAAQALGHRRDLVAAAESMADWADTHWAHPEGGYREGDVTPTPPRRQNPHMHMFEALLALYETTGNVAHLERANAIAKLFHDKLFDQKHGALPEYYDDAWRPLTQDGGVITEPGHHFEWSWLLHRWNRLGGVDLGAIAEKLRVHGEVYGVDLASGAVYNEVYADGRPHQKDSRLWPHTERIKANVVRYERTRDDAAAEAAVQAFDTLMRYCDAPTKGLWRDLMKEDGAFVEEGAPASSFYHIMFALAELIRVAETDELGG